MPLAPYLFLGGTSEEAFRFYERILAGRIEDLLTFAGTEGEGHVPEHWRRKIMHTSLRLADGAVLMGSDGMPGEAKPPQGFVVALHVDDVAEAERVFAALAEGGRVTTPLAETFWAERFGMCVDRFDVPWMINCEGRR
jgi:PhnB protein